MPAVPRRFPSLLFVVLVLAAGCRGRNDFDFAVVGLEIRDLPGPADVVQADFDDIAEYGSGRHLLVLPSDWKKHARAGGSGRPLTGWIRDDGLSPAQYAALNAYGNLSPWSGLRGDAAPDEVMLEALERRRLGQDTYRVERIRLPGDPTRWELRVFGAAERGDPAADGGPTGLAWYEVGTIELTDGLSVSARERRLRYGDGVGGTAFFVVYVALPAWFWIALLG